MAACENVAVQPTPHMPDFLKNPWVILVIGVVVGTAYGSKIPVLGTAAKKLPGASL